MTRQQGLALGAAACFAVAMPLVLLLFGDPLVVTNTREPDRAIIPPPVAPVAAVYERALFAPLLEGSEGGDAAPADAPALVGIAGRLNRDAVALVRLADGGSRSIAVGESVEGWRLESLAIDAAYFTRGRERVRVAMAAADEAETDGAER
ncbi:hypothetical protein [Sphingomonas sp. LT1P40]|uniref:hypothetical protein n=1 Tax=Alteristakelama amylovorans TaxID=3096166 RepID=UPI002FC894B3